MPPKTKLAKGREEERRKQLSFTKTMKALDQIDAAYMALFDPFLYGDDAAISVEEREFRLSVLKAREAHQFKKLDKLLPDLKAVELSADVSGEVNIHADSVAQLSTDAIRRAIAQLADGRASAQGSDGKALELHAVYEA